MELISEGVRTFFTVLVLTCGYALWRGRLPERTAAIGFLLAWVATEMVHTYDWTKPQYGMFAVDLILLVIMVALTLLSGRRWLIAATAFHVLTIGDHVAMMLDLRIRSYAYQTVMVIWGYAVLLAMVLGTWFEAEPERRRLRAASGNPAISG